MENVDDPFEKEDAFFGSLSIEEFQKLDNSIKIADSYSYSQNQNTENSFHLIGENKILRDRLSKVIYLFSFICYFSYVKKQINFYCRPLM